MDCPFAAVQVSRSKQAVFMQIHFTQSIDIKLLAYRNSSHVVYIKIAFLPGESDCIEQNAGFLSEWQIN